MLCDFIGLSDSGARKKDDFGPKPRLRSLWDHFSQIEDPREAWRVAHPLSEVLLLIVCATISSCDDFDDIAAWGENHLPFLRTHWQIENALHWVLGVTFREDLARVRKGHGARNMAAVRHFAINLLRAAPDKKSLKLRRKIAGWDPDYLHSLIQKTPVNLDS